MRSVTVRPRAWADLRMVGRQGDSLSSPHRGPHWGPHRVPALPRPHLCGFRGQALLGPQQLPGCPWGFRASFPEGTLLSQHLGMPDSGCRERTGALCPNGCLGCGKCGMGKTAQT